MEREAFGHAGPDLHEEVRAGLNLPRSIFRIDGRHLLTTVATTTNGEIGSTLSPGPKQGPPSLSTLIETALVGHIGADLPPDARKALQQTHVGVLRVTAAGEEDPVTSRGTTLCVSVDINQCRAHAWVDTRELMCLV